MVKRIPTGNTWQTIAWVFFFTMIVFTNRSLAFDWSITELHYQYGILDTPTFAGGGNAATHILTLQHASGWKYGDNFIFIDFLEDSEKDDFNDTDLYGEAYFNFSLSKIFKTKVGKGPVKDIGALAGINMGADSHVLKYLPGIRLSWDVPGFTFLNTDFTAYIDDSSGIDSGGAPKESDSFYIDINWAYPLRFGSHIFSIEGHMEYIGERTNEFGDKVSEWFFAQPQFRYDLGNTFFEKPNTLFIGIEWQTWINKLGDSKTDENTAQFLMVRRF